MYKIRYIVSNYLHLSQVVNITVIDANGGQNHQQVTTDGSGNGMLQLNGLTAGKYNVMVVYGGNDDYSASNTTQSLEIKEVEVQKLRFYSFLERSSVKFNLDLILGFLFYLRFYIFHFSSSLLSLFFDRTRTLT